MKQPYFKSGFVPPAAEDGYFVLPADAVLVNNDRAYNQGRWATIYPNTRTDTVIERASQHSETVCYTRSIESDKELYSSMDSCVKDLEKQIAALQTQVKELKKKDGIEKGSIVVALSTSARESFKVNTAYRATEVTDERVSVAENSNGGPDSWVRSNFRLATPAEAATFEKDKLTKTLLAEAAKLGFKVGGRFTSASYKASTEHAIDKLTVVFTRREAASGSGAVMTHWDKVEKPFVVIHAKCYVIPLADATAAIIPTVPTVNGYTMDHHVKGNTTVTFGCARISLGLLREVVKSFNNSTYGGNRTVTGVTLSSGVALRHGDIIATLAHVDAVEKL